MLPWSVPVGQISHGHGQLDQRAHARDDVRVARAVAVPREGAPLDKLFDEGGQRAGEDVLEDHCTFHRVQYLGAASINAPRSETEIQRNMAILNAEEASRQAIAVSVAVPTTPQGSVM